jgi:protoporphyrinogen oxidase
MNQTIEKQPGDLKNEKELYDAIIIGGGIAGLCVAYMLRDKNILLLEEEGRFGGRVLSEKKNDAWYNIGTQYMVNGEDDFNKLLDELEIEKKSHKEEDYPFSVYLDNKLYPDLDSLMWSSKNGHFF